MNEVESLLNSTDSTFLAVALGTYNDQKEVTVLEKWLYYQDKNEMPFEYLLKLNTYIPSSEKDMRLKNILFRHVDSHQLNLGSFASIYQITNDDVKRNYCVAIIYNLKKIDMSFEQEQQIKYFLKQITHSTRSALKFQQPLQISTPLISRALEYLNRFTNAHIYKMPDFPSLPADLMFHMIALTSHFETQMSTIIESNDYNQAKAMAQFLANFMFPYQLYHSSFEHLRRPISGLYLQIIQCQAQSPEDILLTFSFPCTWIRLSDKTVWQTPTMDEQISVSGDYNSLVNLNTEDPERERLIQVIKKKYKLTQKTSPCPWVVSSVILVSQAEERIRQRMCALRLESLMNIARSAIDITNNWIGESSFILFEKVRELWEILGLTGKDDMYMIAAVGQILDSTIQGKLFTNRRVVLMQISSV
ncbi:hypothetical protein TVAG_127030 [Trichomonas vaginalis G3]|uniref:Uncharacterized protein n=1 Tax=Trichomonas vaginalis (strain ATCC PRA-98 / G3) TaxID=412133 RepID=A2E7X1_TRIV3|nr:guanine nucleotide exchange c9orf72 family [Trichomonas vaginalis G3]EAY11197.1 hypothetical protein TVAG_127030 [Trichomonas vaginalis G3]KAI5551428.1 guanine nucleotide exchange c9orf72 family [Trichomonas vaginalis G3]|eukprot:XP_001323420.1 hypothetical protein [Trichomonas vaginalis G3]